MKYKIYKNMNTQGDKADWNELMIVNEYNAVEQLIWEMLVEDAGSSYEEVSEQLEVEPNNDIPFGFIGLSGEPRWRYMVEVVE